MKYTYKGQSVSITMTTYSDGKLALIMIDNEDGIGIAKITVNIDETKRNEVAIKTYSENEGMYIWLLRNQIIKPAHRFTRYNYVEIPICLLTEQFLNQNNVSRTK